MYYCSCISVQIRKKRFWYEQFLPQRWKLNLSFLWFPWSYEHTCKHLRGCDITSFHILLHFHWFVTLNSIKTSSIVFLYAIKYQYRIKSNITHCYICPASWKLDSPLHISLPEQMKRQNQQNCAISILTNTTYQTTEQKQVFLQLNSKSHWQGLNN